MTKCKICGEKYKKTGGNFLRHIQNAHSMTKKEYVIETKYDGDPPKCKCGLCNQTPRFYRGDFREWACRKHMRHEWRKKKYIELYGESTCNYEECDNEVGFIRGEPNEYCSHSCSGKDNGGFIQEETQKKIRENIKEKYGVKAVSQLDEVKEKISKAKKGINTWERVSDEKRKRWKEKIGESSKKRWKDDEYKHKVLESITKSVCDSSARSKIHKRVRENLNLQERGYESEIAIGPYIVDEVNEDKKKIIEIFGDYVHANPEMYDAEDLIELPGNSYKAKEKWEHDKKKIEYLESQGYEVSVVWGSDFKTGNLNL